MVLSKGPTLTAEVAELKADNAEKCGPRDQGSLDDILQQAERTQILRALEMADGVVAGPNGAAARLRIKRSTLVSRMHRLGIAESRNWGGCHPQANCQRSYAAS